MQTLALLDLNDLKILMAENTIKNEVWDSAKAADYLDISKPTLFAQAKIGKIPGIQIGNDWKFSSIALYEYVAKKTKGA
ncbi:helix-turn-helix domain-containing protein [Enterococcus montenegrensis]|uniref:helix-turn-helix domain-containing protein n=1 Tax=Enterococcus montenegrensis TaxID=3031993 RepID=UPI00249E8BCD|nr:helix-turn-helix domain-containing protein [Enterococcus montenegrensis]WHA08823.1 helix-turn-helix domain-containing protein [Enterococcus montenegrensis]